MPEGHQPLAGSERNQPGGARRTGEVDPGEQVTIRVILRRRTDTPLSGSEVPMIGPDLTAGAAGLCRA